MSAFVPKADIDSIKETLTCAVQTPREALSKTGGFRNPGAAADNKRPLPKPGQDLDRAKAMGVSLFAGEAEGRLDEVLLDATAGALKPLYNYMDDHR